MKNRISYKNGTYFQTEVLYKKGKNLHDSDRIKVTLYGATFKTKSVFYIHALEAIDLIQILSNAVGEVVSKELPLFSRD